MGNLTNLKGKHNHLKLQRWAPEWWMDELTPSTCTWHMDTHPTYFDTFGCVNNLVPWVPCWIWSHRPKNPGPPPWLTKIRVAIAVACGAVWLSHMTLSGWLSLTQIIGIKCLNIWFSHMISSNSCVLKCQSLEGIWVWLWPHAQNRLVRLDCQTNNRFLFHCGKPKQKIPSRVTTTCEHSMISMGSWHIMTNGHMLSWLVEPTAKYQPFFRWFLLWFLFSWHPQLLKRPFHQCFHWRPEWPGDINKEKTANTQCILLSIWYTIYIYNYIYIYISCIYILLYRCLYDSVLLLLLCFILVV